ncbi:PREDICTED: oxidoreductase NAD-binding domain-containing protein 1 [Elephantulus edwardii]|uniref:oxidoreductase NAD-binding domain-containing protein 1 n=1 Tax=Elephantulus edwardii TaxID=28737 RepID=UPI0003F08441|nr:PREDICTED: oxidoreductase NAD-binding domain-containing protein 1 [Elephantulus edwardii]
MARAAATSCRRRRRRNVVTFLEQLGVQERPRALPGLPRPHEALHARPEAAASPGHPPGPGRPSGRERRFALRLSLSLHCLTVHGVTCHSPWRHVTSGRSVAGAVDMIPGVFRGCAGTICSQVPSWRLSALRHLTLPRVMKSHKKTDHMERTANVARWEVVSTAKVCGLADESPSVKMLRLHVAKKDLAFRAGQWVDFSIPGVPVVGGFSICSSPRLLQQERILELAVKYTTHPPALWVHSQCTLDSEVALRVGGDFFFDPQPHDASRNLVLIAGGVGINPLLSILRHAADLLRERAATGRGYEVGTVSLFYSARNTSELLFTKNILELVNEFPEKIACSLHVTKQTTPISADLKPYVTEGRIKEEEIRDLISRETLFYICGPPPMTDFFSKQLEGSHVPREHICFEKWW